MEIVEFHTMEPWGSILILSIITRTTLIIDVCSKARSST